MSKSFDGQGGLTSKGAWTFLMFVCLVALDQLIVSWLDHWVYVWPGRTPPHVFPFWASLPRLAFYFFIGYAVWRILRLTTCAMLVFLAAVLAYFYFARLGTYYVYGGLSDYAWAYLPVMAVPVGFLAGYLLARQLSARRRAIFPDAK